MVTESGYGSGGQWCEAPRVKLFPIRVSIESNFSDIRRFMYLKCTQKARDKEKQKIHKKVERKKLIFSPKNHLQLQKMFFARRGDYDTSKQK